MKAMLIRLLAIVGCCLIGAGSAMAQDNLFIETPVSGTVVSPGQSLDIVMRQATGLAPVYFDEAIGLFPSPVFGAQTVLSADPYVVRVRINTSAKSGEYVIVGMAKRRGASDFVKTKPITIVLRGAAIASIAIQPKTMILRFPGDSAFADVEAHDVNGSFVTLSEADVSRMVWSVDDQAVAAVTSDGRVVGKLKGYARVSVDLNGMKSYMDVVVQTPSMRGDLNGDNIVDAADIAIVQAVLNRETQVPEDARDINGDGKIDALDLRVLTTLCRHPQCATQ